MSLKVKEALRFGVIVFSIGMAWGTLMFEIRATHADVLALEARTATTERYLIQESKGRFIPAMPEGPAADAPNSNK